MSTTFFLDDAPSLAALPGRFNAEGPSVVSTSDSSTARHARLRAIPEKDVESCGRGSSRAAYPARLSRQTPFSGFATGYLQTTTKRQKRRGNEPDSPGTSMGTSTNEKPVQGSIKQY